MVTIFLVAIFALIFIGFLYNARKNFDYTSKQVRSDEIKNNKKQPSNMYDWRNLDQNSWSDTTSWAIYTTWSTTGELQ